MLESSSQHVDSYLEIDQDLLDKETLDEEMWAAARAQQERDTPGTDGSEEEDAIIIIIIIIITTFLKHLFPTVQRRYLQG